VTLKYAHQLTAGEQYEALEFLVTSDLNHQFLYAVEDFSPIYLEGRAGKPPLVHPVLFMHMSPRTRSPSYRQASGMGSAFVRDRSRYANPGFVGSTFRVTWTVTATYEKRGRVYQEYTAVLRDDEGLEILSRDLVSTFFMLDRARDYQSGDQK
jgi:hypothetical protein